MAKSSAASVIAAVLVIVAVLLRHEDGAGAWLVALVYSLALLVGAWAAPQFNAAGALGGSFLGGWRRTWDGPKSVQVLSAGAAVAALTLLNLFDPGIAVIVGIVVALAVGAALPVPEDSGSEQAHRADPA